MPSKTASLEFTIHTTVRRRLLQYVIGWGLCGAFLGMVAVFLAGLQSWHYVLWAFIGALIVILLVGLPWWFIDCAVIYKWKMRGFNTTKMTVASTIGFLICPWFILALIFFAYDSAAEREYIKRQVAQTAKKSSKKPAKASKSTKKTNKSAKTKAPKSKKVALEAPKTLENTPKNEPDIDLEDDF